MRRKGGRTTGQDGGETRKGREEGQAACWAPHWLRQGQVRGLPQAVEVALLVASAGLLLSLCPSGTGGQDHVHGSPAPALGPEAVIPESASQPQSASIKHFCVCVG